MSSVDIDHGGYPFACYDCADRYEEQPEGKVCADCGGPVVEVLPLYELALDAGETCTTCSKPAIWKVDQHTTDPIPKCAGHGAGFQVSDTHMIVDAERPDYADGDSGETVDDDQDEREALVEPQPAGSLPKYLVEGVEKQKPDRLRRLAEYAEQMADYKEEQAQRDLDERVEQDVNTTPGEWDVDGWEDVVDDARDEADLEPGEGTITTKTIDGRDYYYLQWRAGSKIKSQYVAPVTPADSEG